MPARDRPLTTSGKARADAKRPKSVHPLVIGVSVVAVLLGATLLSRLFGSESALVGHSAPDFSLELVHNGEPGSRIRLSDMTGHPVLLDFWASWCGPCQIEAPLVERVYQHLKAQGVVVVGVDTSDEPGLAPSFAKAKGLTYPIAYDAGDRVAASYGVDSLPTIVVVDAKGNIAAVRTGVEGEGELERLLRSAM